MIGPPGIYFHALCRALFALSLQLTLLSYNLRHCTKPLLSVCGKIRTVGVKNLGAPDVALHAKILKDASGEKVSNGCSFVTSISISMPHLCNLDCGRFQTALWRDRRAPCYAGQRRFAFVADVPSYVPCRLERHQTIVSSCSRGVPSRRCEAAISLDRHVPRVRLSDLIQCRGVQPSHTFDFAAGQEGKSSAHENTKHPRQLAPVLVRCVTPFLQAKGAIAACSYGPFPLLCQ
jgi:hypothetical protein